MDSILVTIYLFKNRLKQKTEKFDLFFKLRSNK